MMHRPPSSSSKTSETTTSSAANHDRHDHHRAGKPDGTCARFPRPEYAEYGDTGNLEVLGLDFFMHARCPYSSAQACYCGRYACHLDSLIVAVDGACPGNGSEGAVRSGCGVYFGQRDPENGGQQNLFFQVAEAFGSPARGFPHTSQRVELHAAIAALAEAKKFATEGGQWPCSVPDDCPAPCPLRHLVIKSDSAYLVTSMTETIGKWQANGWRTAKKTPVKNRDLWETLIQHVDEYSALGVAVDFWHVLREQNEAADRLAEMGIDSGRVYTQDGLLCL